MKQRMILIGLIILLFSGMCIIENDADRNYPRQPSCEASSVYMLAGEFRVVFANLLWIKVDRYHHEFIEHNPDWSQNKELIGLLKLIVMLDPHFDEAYADMAYIYTDAYKDDKKALSVLLQGLANNPRARELNEVTAIMYARRMNDPQTALAYAINAVKYGDDDFYLRRDKMLVQTIKRMITNNHYVKNKR